MFLQSDVKERASNKDPVRVCLVGAGKFGSMFLSQVPSIEGIEIVAIVDLDKHSAKATCLKVGWTKQMLCGITFSSRLARVFEQTNFDVMVEATGCPIAGVSNALLSFDQGCHVVMVNVEADVLAGAYLANTAHSKGLIYSMAYGDQPALVCEMVDWAEINGFHVMAAGKGTKYLPAFHSSTPKTVWNFYGLSEKEARNANMNAKMFNSFLDGTKSGLEMAAVANATELRAPEDGLSFPPSGIDDLANVLQPFDEGGCLYKDGQVEVVSCLQRDGSSVFQDLRWGVFVVVKAPNKYTAECFKQYGMNTDTSGNYSAMYKPFHLIGLELASSIFSVVLQKKPTGAAKQFKADVIAIAKFDLVEGTVLDGEGGYTVWGKLTSSKRSLELNAVPIGLATNIHLNKNIKSGSPILWDDVELGELSDAYKIRKKMQAFLK